VRRLSLWLSLIALAHVRPLAAQATDARPAAATGTRATFGARRLESGTSIRIDGALDEPAWRSAPVASDFRQREPLEGQPATEAT
jgi:hypothetical protein